MNCIQKCYNRGSVVLLMPCPKTLYVSEKNLYQSMSMQREKSGVPLSLSSKSKFSYISLNVYFEISKTNT